MLEAIRKVMEFAQTESALYHLSGYPKTPAGAWNLFLRKHGKTSFKASKGMREKFKNKKVCFERFNSFHPIRCSGRRSD